MSAHQSLETGCHFSAMGFGFCLLIRNAVGIKVRNQSKMFSVNQILSNDVENQISGDGNPQTGKSVPEWKVVPGPVRVCLMKDL